MIGWTVRGRAAFATTLAATRPAPWLALLRAHRVDPAYWPRAAVATGAAALQGLAAPFAPATLGPVPPPIFVLGHLRSGTTFLHELLAAHPDLAAPTWADVCNPSGHPWTRALLVRLLRRALPAARHDDVPLRPESPAECDFALAGLGLSPYLAWSFPRDAARFEPYLALRGLTAEEHVRWRFEIRAAGRAVEPRPPPGAEIPPHTARVPVLARMFPDARFVFMHRDPLAVLASTLRMERQGLETLRLQRPAGDPTEAAIRRYGILHARFDADRAALAGRLAELSYAELVAAPERALQRLAEFLGLAPYDPHAPALRAALDRHAARPPAAPPAVPPALAERLRHEWAPWFAAFGAARAAA